MGGIIEQLGKSGEDISDEMPSHISLLLHKHAIPMGAYFADGNVEQSATEDV